MKPTFPQTEKYPSMPTDTRPDWGYKPDACSVIEFASRLGWSLEEAEELLAAANEADFLEG